MAALHKKESKHSMLRPWTFPIEIAADGDKPIYQQISSSLIAEIQRGRLKPGMALPGTRALSKLLAVNRNTVATAYEELIAQGWVSTEQSRGTFVARRLPRLVSRRNLQPAALLQPVAAPKVRGGSRPALRVVEAARVPHLSFADEGPDRRLESDADFQEAFRRASRTQLRSGWTYCDPRGAAALRNCVAEMLRTRRGVLAEPEQLLITRGRQMALYLCAQTLLGPDSVVAIEQPGQKRVWETFRLTGARVIGLPVDEHGLQVDVLRRLGKSHRIRAVYVTPEHQYPTTVSMSASRRRELLQWAEETGAVIIEEEMNHEYRYDQGGPLALSSQDHNGSVVYLSSFSRMLLPGMNLGFISTTDARIRHMAQIRSLIDRQGESAMELSVAQLMRGGKLQRRIARTIDSYRERRDLLITLLERYLGASVKVVAPSSGGAVWVHPQPAVNTRAWSVAAAEAGVGVCASMSYSLEDCANGGMRLSFTTLAPQEMEQAVRLLAEAYPGRARLKTAS